MPAEIKFIISGEDRSGAAFQSAQRNLSRFAASNREFAQRMAGGVVGGAAGGAAARAPGWLDELRGQGGEARGMMRFAGAIGKGFGVEIVANQLTAAVGKATELAKQFHDSKMNAGELADQLLRLVPVFGAGYRFGTALREAWKEWRHPEERQAEQAVSEREKRWGKVGAVVLPLAEEAAISHLSGFERERAVAGQTLEKQRQSLSGLPSTAQAMGRADAEKIWRDKLADIRKREVKDAQDIADDLTEKTKQREADVERQRKHDWDVDVRLNEIRKRNAQEFDRAMAKQEKGKLQTQLKETEERYEEQEKALRREPAKASVPTIAGISASFQGIAEILDTKAQAEHRARMEGFQKEANAHLKALRKKIDKIDQEGLEGGD